MRARLAVAGALVVGVVATALLARARVAIVLVVCEALFAALAALWVSPSWRAAHPVGTRLAQTVMTVDALGVASAFVSTSVNGNLEAGVSMTIVLLGLSFLTGSSGQISLGHGAFMGVGAFAAAIWANHHAHSPVVIALLAAVVAGAAVGFLLGLPATRLRGPYLAGMTLAFAVAFGSILNAFSSWTGGDSGLQLPTAVSAPRWLVDLLPPSDSPLAAATVWLSQISLVVAGVALFAMSNLFASRVGRSMRLVRDHDVAAELAGVSLPRARVVAFVISAAYAALGGALSTLVNNSVSPATYGFALSITILALMVIGGIGTIPGAMIGGLIFVYSTSSISWITARLGLNPQGNLASQLNGIIFGVLLVGAIVSAPMGIAGAGRQVARRWRERHHLRAD